MGIKYMNLKETTKLREFEFECKCEPKYQISKHKKTLKPKLNKKYEPKIVLNYHHHMVHKGDGDNQQ